MTNSDSNHPFGLMPLKREGYLCFPDSKYIVGGMIRKLREIIAFYQKSQDYEEVQRIHLFIESELKIVRGKK